METPSFYSLFRHSHHFRPLLEESLMGTDLNDPAIKRERKDCERYAVAAVGFCLHHDEKFRREFIEMIVQPAASIEWASVCVSIEPNHQADMLIRAGNAFAAVIEFKINANLESHQDPNHEAFGLDRGYGKRFANDEAYKNVKDRFYIVLGQNDWKPPNSSCVIDKKKIEFKGVHWSQLRALHADNERILHDLFFCLGLLGVRTMTNLKARETCVHQSLHQACVAEDILYGVIEDLKLRRKSVAIKHITKEEGQWEFGVYVNRVPEEARNQHRFHAELSDNCNAPNLISWFGYVQSDDLETACAHAELYAESAEKSKMLRDKLNHKLPNILGSKLAEWTDTYAVLLTKASDKEPDLEWFLRVLKAAV